MITIDLELAGIMEPVIYRLSVAFTYQDWRDISMMCHGAGLAVGQYDRDLANRYYAIGKYAGKYADEKRSASNG